MLLKNSSNHYGKITIIIHWVMAVLLIGLLIMGLYMVRLPIALEKLKLYGWHKEYGILVLLLAIVRLFWRLMVFQYGNGQGLKKCRVLPTHDLVLQYLKNAFL